MALRGEDRIVLSTFVNPAGILFVTVVSGVMGMAVLGSLLPAAISGVRHWIAANALSIVAFCLFSFQGHGPFFLTNIVANGLLALVVLMALQGCRKFFNRPSFRWAEYAALVALLLALEHWTYRSPNIDARIAAVSAFHAYFYASIAWLAKSASPSHRPSYSYRFMSIAALLCVAIHVSRGLVYEFGVDRLTTLHQPTPINLAFLGLGILMMPSLSIGMVMLVHDRIAERLEQLANLDGLTGVLARRAFLDRAEAAMKETKLTRAKLSIAIIDIDHFKSINDRYGHAAGDQVLVHFASVVSDILRSSDLFGRLGGEEFGILSRSTDRSGSVAILDRLRVHVSKSPCGVASEDLFYTFSAGVDEYCNGDTLVDLMARADAALYAAKATGRNCVVAA